MYINYMTAANYVALKTILFYATLSIYEQTDEEGADKDEKSERSCWYFGF